MEDNLINVQILSSGEDNGSENSQPDRRLQTLHIYPFVPVHATVWWPLWRPPEQKDLDRGLFQSRGQFTYRFTCRLGWRCLPAYLSLSITAYKLPVSFPRIWEDSEFSDSWPSGVNPDMLVRLHKPVEASKDTYDRLGLGARLTPLRVCSCLLVKKHLCNYRHHPGVHCAVHHGRKSSDNAGSSTPRDYSFTIWVEKD